MNSEVPVNGQFRTRSFLAVRKTDTQSLTMQQSCIPCEPDLRNSRCLPLFPQKPCLSRMMLSLHTDARPVCGGIKLPNSAAFPLPLSRTRYILHGYLMREMLHG